MAMANVRIERAAAAVVALLMTGAAVCVAADRPWQQGRWTEVQIVRPRVAFGVISRDPAAAGRPSPVTPVEDRRYVIETDVLRLEVKHRSPTDERLDAAIGEPVTFALDKDTIYIKDIKGKEHRLSVSKKTSKAK